MPKNILYPAAVKGSKKRRQKQMKTEFFNPPYQNQHHIPQTSGSHPDKKQKQNKYLQHPDIL